VRILSVQSSVVFGQVGHGAAAFPLQRLGHEVWAVPTVVFSNHTGYPTVHGFRLSAAQVADLVSGLDERGALAGCDAVLSGYLGDDGLVDVVIDAVGRVRMGRPEAPYVCDPVLGDATQGLFVSPETARAVRDRLVPAADVVTPNTFELASLTGIEPTDVESTLEAAHALIARGPHTVLVTSVRRDDASIGMLAVTREGGWLAETPLLPLTPHGTGDLTAALFAAHLLETGDPATALGRTTASVYAVVEATLASGHAELAIVAAQDEIAVPQQRFPVICVD